MSGRARVIIYLKAPEDGPEAIEKAYHEISGTLTGTPGLLANELLASTLQPGSFAVLSDWASMADFQKWEQGASHRNSTSPLRPFQDRDGDRHYGIYEVVASY